MVTEAYQRVLRVHFACNDPRNGSFAHQCNAVEIEHEDGDPLLKWSFIEDGLSMEWDEDRITLSVGKGLDETLVLHVHVRRRHVGNWCWDMTTMFGSAAFELGKWLIEHVDTPDEWIPDDPIGALGDRKSETAAGAAHG